MDRHDPTTVYTTPHTRYPLPTASSHQCPANAWARQQHGWPGHGHRFLHPGHVHPRYAVPEAAASIRSGAQDVSDEIEFAPPKPPVKDIVGGGGTYAALGARIFSPAPASGRVGWIVDCGSDFPPGLRDQIGHWHSGVLMRETPDRLTTRGWNGYGAHEQRGTTPRC